MQDNSNNSSKKGLKKSFKNYFKTQMTYAYFLCIEDIKMMGIIIISITIIFLPRGFAEMLDINNTWEAIGAICFLCFVPLFLFLNRLFWQITLTPVFKIFPKDRIKIESLPPRAIINEIILNTIVFNLIVIPTILIITLIKYIAPFGFHL